MICSETGSGQIRNASTPTDDNLGVPSESALEVQGLSKVFKLYDSPFHRLKESIHPFGKKYHRDFYALRDVTFSVARGESVAIVGKNGSGKSTLLKIISGVLTPTAGTLTVNGRVSALLELGAGFNPEMTGTENVIFNGMLMGFSQQEMEAKLDGILAFADIGEFASQPVKTYSSGMFVRLAFAVGVHVEPDILIIDEALSVGDAYFQRKCISRMESIRDSGATIFFVSHDPVSVKSLCRRAILLEKGSVVDIGKPKYIMDLYETAMLESIHTGERSVAVSSSVKTGMTISTGELELVEVTILDDQGTPLSDITSEEIVTIAIVMKALANIDQPHFGLSIRNRYGISIFETNTHCMGMTTSPLVIGQTATIKFTVRFNLASGEYFISVGAANKPFGRDSFREFLLWLYDVHKISVCSNKNSIIYSGIFNMEPDVSVEY